MNDTFEIRKAMIKVDETDDSAVTTNSVVIQLSNTLPLVLIHQDILDSKTVNTTEYVAANNDDASIKNTLYDPGMEDRFIYITTTTSPITGSKARFYYDAKYEDIIVIPDTIAMGSGDDTISGKVFELFGYRIGGGHVKNKNDINTTLPLLPSNIQKLVATNKNIDSKTYSVLIDGISPAVSGKGFITSTVADGATFRRTTVTPITFVEFGTKSDLFSEDTKLYVYDIFQQTFSRFRMKDLNLVDTGDYKLYTFFEL